MTVYIKQIDVDEDEVFVRFVSTDYPLLPTWPSDLNTAVATLGLPPLYWSIIAVDHKTTDGLDELLDVRMPYVVPRIDEYEIHAKASLPNPMAPPPSTSSRRFGKFKPKKREQMGLL